MTDPNNYRPIKILSCLNKLFTAVLNERLTDFLDENDMLNATATGLGKPTSDSDPASFQVCLNSFHKYCIDLKLTVNESKTKIVVFGARKTDYFNFRFGDSTLEIVDKFKYLGTVFSQSGSFLNARKYVTAQAKKVMYLLNIRI